MAIPRFYCPLGLADGAEVQLPDPAARHANRVLRLSAGDKVVLFDGAGGEYEGALVEIGKSRVVAAVSRRRDAERESPLPVTLVQAVCAAEKMDLVVQKAVELGVSRIQPVAASRSVVRLAEERAAKRLEHWRNVVIAACEQCGRNRVPMVLPLVEFTAWLGQQGAGDRGQGTVEGTPSPELRLMLSPFAEVGLRDLPNPAGEITLLVGPEGGFSAEELKAAAVAGFIPVRLGPRILRAETAGLAALAAMQALWGDF